MALATPLYALRSFFTDKCGTPLAGGLVYSYENNTLTPKNTYTDASLQIPNTNPVILDETGKADIFLNGVYRFQVFSRDGVLIEDKSDVFNIVDLSKVAEKEVVDAQFAAQQEALNTKAPLSITTELQQQKVDKTYFDTTLSSFQNGAVKTYPTLAAANADIANIALDTKVSVLSSTEGGDYYKASADATSLTKSPWDPVAQAKADATTKANAAEANAKIYADANKLDLKAIKYSYQDGNKIGSKSEKATNFGLNGSRVLSNSSAVDSVCIPVTEQSLLILFNDKATFSPTVQAVYAFFADDPLVNRTQNRIVHTSVTKIDTSSGITYQEVIVPDGAKYLLLNTRFTSGGVTTAYNWAVHENFFVASYAPGHEYISKIENSSTEKYPLLYDNTPIKSRKNLYTGNSIPEVQVNDNGASKSSNYDDVLSPFIPVEFGKTYTISGLSPSKMGNGTVRVLGFINPTIPSTAVKLLGTVRGDSKITVTIDDSSILYIAFPIIRSGFGTAAEADNLAIQVEVGNTATSYEPAYYTKSILKLSSRIDEDNVSSNLNLVSQFTQMDIVRDPSLSVLTPISKTVGPYGLNYKLAGLSSDGNASNNLYGQISFATAGKKSINVNIMKRVDGERAVGALKRTAFNIPSGCLDNPDSFPYVNQYPKDLYVHPSIAYSSTGVAGFKYWMISSAFPPTSDGGSLWEDEDLFVSNDAINWQRVRSLYETNKSYTTSTLRLPPQTLVTNNARKYCFLPSPAMGDSLEVSVPASNGMPAQDRVMITLDQQNPWKHDPFIMIDGGYVYTYHTFHLPTQERTGGKNRFIVCVRTQNGIDWDVVRSDGSTMRLTEATSRQIFTKDAQGRYNFIYYGYDLPGSNPEIIKFGEGDYEFFYGSNFAVKFTGTTPYTFDFSNRIPIQTKAAGNHPTIVNDGGVLYLITNTGMYRSENRGASWTDLPHYPMWQGGVSGMSYKKSTCKGEGGKFLLIDVQRHTAQAYTASTFNIINDINNMFIYEYASFTDFLNKANNGLVDAYLDLYLTKANPIKSTREVIQLPYITPTLISGTGLEVTQRLKVADIDVDAGDIVYLNVTLNSRRGAEIIFGGIDIS